MRAKRAAHPVLRAGRRQTKVDVPRMLRLCRRWLRLHPQTDPWPSRGAFYLWEFRGYYDVDSAVAAAVEAGLTGDQLAALILTLSAGLTGTQRSKIAGCMFRGRSL